MTVWQHFGNWLFADVEGWWLYPSRYLLIRRAILKSIAPLITSLEQLDEETGKAKEAIAAMCLIDINQYETRFGFMRRLSRRP